MKKLFSIISAALIGLMAVSCIQEKFATFDPTNATAPILGTVEVGAKNVTVTYTPGEFHLGFNDKMAPTHSLALVAADGKAVSKIITSKDSGYSLMATNVNISKALAFLGYADGDVVSSLDFVVRASIQDPTKDNGRNGFVDSQAYTLTNFTVTLPQGSPYADYTEPTTWSVIGSLSNYEISWDGDLEMFATEDGEHLVAKAVKLSKDDEFKFRKDQSWDVNMGGEFSGLDSEFAVTQDGPNVKVGADGTYDLWLDLSAGTASVTDAYMAYPDHKDASEWTVIGSLSEYGISWDGDLPMITDGKTHVAQGIKISASDEFKFRKDKSWDVNMGGEFGSLGSEFTVTQDGANIKVGADGIYDLILDPNGSATIVETLGGGVSGKIGGDEPEPEPIVVTGWNIIGLNGDWNNDILATENDGVWTAYITAEDATEFKWRKDAGWDENYGGTFVAFGEPFAAVAGGDNIKVEAGFYKVVLNLKDESAPTITVFNDFEVWSLIGGFNDWAGDVDMVLTDGKWVSPATAISGEFKIRKNHGWDTNYGGTMEELGKAFAAVAGGDNIKVDEGEYVVTFDPTALTILVETAMPSNTWSVIGVDGDWSTDHFMTEVMPGIWVSEMLNISEEGWKVRFNHGWDVNRGGATPKEIGQFVEAVPGGDNINLTGEFKVVYNALNGTIGTLGWGVVGSIASIDGFNWNNDIPMNRDANEVWYSVPVKLSAGDEIKLRWGATWDNNIGLKKASATKAEEGGDEVFALETNGDNLKVTKDGTYMIVYDPTTMTLTLSTDFWSLIGEFNGWAADNWMMPDGTGKWYAYHLDITGGWKVRKGAGWDVNYGGAYVAAGEPFTGVPGGDNIAVTDLTNFSVVLDTAAATITVNK